MLCACQIALKQLKALVALRTDHFDKSLTGCLYLRQPYLILINYCGCLLMEKNVIFNIEIVFLFVYKFCDVSFIK